MEEILDKISSLEFELMELSAEKDNDDGDLEEAYFHLTSAKEACRRWLSETT